LSLSQQFKLSDGLSIYYAEAFAVYKALLYIKEFNLNNICIISDSAKVLNDVKLANFDRSPHPFLVCQICNIISSLNNNNIILKWLPGHSNVTDFLKTDQLAKMATNSDIIHHINFSRNEAIQLVDEWIWKTWECDWQTNQTCKYQTMFSVSKNYLHFNMSRRKCTIITRLRLMQCKLNAGLFKIGLHRDGLCTTCGVLQDGVHLLMECIETEPLRIKLKKNIRNLKNWNYQFLVSDPLSVNLITEFLIKNNFDI